jgi:hypothetical protein
MGLHIHWLWLQKTDASLPWARLPVHVPRQALAHLVWQLKPSSAVGNQLYSGVTDGCMEKQWLNWPQTSLARSLKEL